MKNIIKMCIISANKYEQKLIKNGDFIVKNENCNESDNSNNPIWLYLIFKLVENEWDNYRKIAYENADNQELFEYFDSIFNNDFREIVIEKGTKLYRARQIKSDNEVELGLNDLNFEKFRDYYEEFKKFNETNDNQMLNFGEILFFLNGIYYHDNKISEKIKDLLSQLKQLQFVGFKKNECGVPPRKFRNENRLSNKDDEYLYLSFDVHTALSEMRPTISQKYSIAECQTVSKLKILNLHDYSAYDVFSKISCLINKISQPNTDNDSSFYAITQKLSHYIRKKGFDGITYKSAIANKGINLLLFNADNVEFINSKIYQVKNVDVKYEKLFSI